MITIVDYDTGNLRSVENALRKLGAQYRLSSSAQEISVAEKILLPGVGEAATAMEKLRERSLAEVIRGATQPVLGICLGMQLLCSHSEEGDSECLGIFPNRVRRLTAAAGIKIPHMGWNRISSLKTKLMTGVAEGDYVYYVHSYAADINGFTIATTNHGTDFSGALGRDNFFGCQFHPEKSGGVGERIFSNFLKI
ncbi:Imidazole glycerol phosphate synthase amidotransferase subunit [Mucinivorans hirudinis]|uniref:Imidazole glycerol phosphate synthase subunit HisH n=1 Tax=Mucinivorans hirudinis TaxID=1433126 RepID=A0A060RD77_9BACT|nr:Imidazole glycerol phosphate synthase amidotransferase subunit [Mucinivorans hirudinis]